jgi:RNA polymerase sigma-70 factor (ECF subfamily)
MGAPKSFDEFFLDESERLLRVLCFVTGSRTAAEDIAQDAFTKLYERWDSVGTLEDPAGYLHRTAMNMFRNEFRRAKRSLKRAAFARSESDDVFAAVDDRDVLSHALSQLTDRQRAALVLTEVLGYSGQEVADLLGIQSSTVYALTHQARATLSESAGVRDV